MPIIVKNLPSYLSIRTKLGGELLLIAKSKKVCSFLKENLHKIKNVNSDTTKIEKNWVQVYKRSTKSTFYRHVNSLIQNLPRCKTILEHGCSIGHVSQELAKRAEHVFGMDTSFYAVLEAKRKNLKNSDFVVANSLAQPFGNKKFNMVVALNVLDLVEPLELLKILSSQAKNFLILSDPYDFERGKDSVKTPVDANGIRQNLTKKGFQLIQNTRYPSYIPWKLNINDRLYLNYKVDLIIAKKLESITP